MTKCVEAGDCAAPDLVRAHAITIGIMEQQVEEFREDLRNHARWRHEMLGKFDSVHARITESNEKLGDRINGLAIKIALFNGGLILLAWGLWVLRGDLP